LSVPDEARLSQKLDECLERRDQMITHAEHLQEDLAGTLETLGRVGRLLAKWKQDREFFLQGEGVRGRSEALNWLDKHIEELSDALGVAESQEGREK
jgi:hypothetical protein